MKDNKTKPKTRKKRITFSLDAAHARAVYLAGEFNDWNPRKHPMKKDENGVWTKQLVLAPGLFEYKFLVDDQWVTDPHNERTCTNSFGTLNSVVRVIE